jgi:hypothetical protein
MADLLVCLTGRSESGVAGSDSPNGLPHLRESRAVAFSAKPLIYR